MVIMKTAVSVIIKGRYNAFLFDPYDKVYSHVEGNEKSYIIEITHSLCDNRYSLRYVCKIY
jgi:predicted transcriptional regulator